MDHYQFLFKNIPVAERDILIAMLDNIGFSGFEEEENSLKGFLPTDKFNEGEFKKIITHIRVEYEKSVIEQTNWNKEWESGFSPVIIFNPVTGHPFASVRANFHERIPEVPYDLIITPKMSFGTGHHATTCLMIEQMSQLNITGKIVIDFGTGTGVLAILAEKLGAHNVAAIDNDDWSINNARENIDANQCNRIMLYKADTVVAEQEADLIMANINLNVIISNIEAIFKAAGPSAIFLFSGIMMHDLSQLIEVLKRNKLKVLNYSTKDKWVVVYAKHG